MPERTENLAFPPGTELVFGPQANRRRHVADVVARIFRAWGFDEIVLPGFDTREDDSAHLYHLSDGAGRSLTLRADFTRIAAKALAIELRREQRIIQATYEGRVFRFRPAGHGATVEQTQRGLEWVNVSGPVYDAAQILIARECLDALEIKQATTVIGHAGFIQAVLTAKGRAEPRLLEAIDHKNPARIREVAKRTGLPASTIRLLEALPSLCGGQEVLEQVRQYQPDAPALAALDELAQVMDLLQGTGDGLLIDLGEVRRFDYYSGVMFKVYHPGLPEELGGGGRYDRLFDRFGLDVPAVGFGFNLARLTEATPRVVPETSEVEEIQASGGADALRRAVLARRQGRNVRIREGGA